MFSQYWSLSWLTALLCSKQRGAADGTRTRNKQLGRLLLYQLNYRRNSGRGDWIRTSGPLLPKQVRYQAAPRPEVAIKSNAHDSSFNSFMCKTFESFCLWALFFLGAKTRLELKIQAYKLKNWLFSCIWAGGVLG